MIPPLPGVWKYAPCWALQSPPPPGCTFREQGTKPCCWTVFTLHSMSLMLTVFYSNFLNFFIVLYEATITLGVENQRISKYLRRKDNMRLHRMPMNRCNKNSSWTAAIIDLWHRIRFSWNEDDMFFFHSKIFHTLSIFLTVLNLARCCTCVLCQTRTTGVVDVVFVNIITWCVGCERVGELAKGGAVVGRPGTRVDGYSSPWAKKLVLQVSKHGVARSKGLDWIRHYMMCKYCNLLSVNDQISVFRWKINHAWDARTTCI
jgi:hypothetical protein